MHPTGDSGLLTATLSRESIHPCSQHLNLIYTHNYNYNYIYIYTILWYTSTAYSVQTVPSPEKQNLKKNEKEKNKASGWVHDATQTLGSRAQSPPVGLWR